MEEGAQMNATVLIGDVRERLPEIPDESVHCAVFSPPYFSLRSYLPKGDPRKGVEIGSEDSPEAYVETMVAVMREVWRVLHPSGTVFLNIGDTYSSSGHGPDKKAAKADWDGSGPTVRAIHGIDPLNLMLVPERLLLALQADGWIVRSRIVWRKAQSFDPEDVGTCMPESCTGPRWTRHRVKVEPSDRATSPYQTAYGDAPQGQGVACRADREAYFEQGVGGTKYILCPGCPKCSPNGGYVLRWGNWRPTSAYEFIWMLTKTNRSYHDDMAVKEAHSRDWTNTGGSLANAPRYAEDSLIRGASGEHRGDGPPRMHPEGRNLRNVWSIPPEPMTAGRCAQCGYLYTGAQMGRLKKNAEHRRICSACGSTKWVSHYATYPTELARICVKVGTSEKGVCPKCGWPWVRMVEGPPTYKNDDRHMYVGPYRNQLPLPSNTDTLDRKRACGADASGEYHGTALKDHEAAGTQNPSDVKRNVLNGMDAGEVTVGWKPSCNCGTDLAPVPATVLDPFWGAGTTGVAALELGRRVIGIELDERVIDLRFADFPLLWAMVQVNTTDLAR